MKEVTKKGVFANGYKSFTSTETSRSQSGPITLAKYKLIAEGSFPEQIKIGPKISAWPEQTIDQWISRQIEGGVQ